MSEEPERPVGWLAEQAAKARAATAETTLREIARIVENPDDRALQRVRDILDKTEIGETLAEAGLVVVPREPTEAMLTVEISSMWDSGNPDSLRGARVHIYQAMIAEYTK